MMKAVYVRGSVGCVLALLSLASLHAQTGSVAGSIHDQQSGEEIVGGTVLLVGTKLGATTDLDGKFLIRNIPVGTYDLRVSFIGYGTKTVNGLQIRDGETLHLSVNLTPVVLQAEEVTVTAERVLSNEAAILAERKKAAAIGDGISREQMQRTPDATSGDALRRVTGISIVDNKFVFVRGVTDRYNQTTLDGAAVTSTEAGKKGFSFDLLPANLLENTTVVKSATPDLPADFTGGLVQLTTLDFPDRTVLKLSATTSYNTATTRGAFLASQGGGKDWLAYDDGSRKLPDVLPGDMQALAQALPNTWAPRATRAPYNGSFSLALGDRLVLDAEDPADGQLGYIGALSYRNSFQRHTKVIDDNETGRYSEGTKDQYSVLWGAIANLSYGFGGRHKISFKNNYDRSADDEVTKYTTTEVDNLKSLMRTEWTQRSTYTGQLNGDHALPEFGGLGIQWRASVSSSRRLNPDQKEFTYQKDITDPTRPFAATENSLYWSGLSERAASVSVDLTLPVDAAKIRFGGLATSQSTSYWIRHFLIRQRFTFQNYAVADSLSKLPLEVIYAPQNFGSAASGKFFLEENSRPNDNYDGQETITAAYFMTDLPFTVADQNFRFVGGVRVERARQTVFSPVDTAQNELKNTDVLPSANLTYLISDKINLRFAYSHSVNRPEFRERARSIFYDFINKQDIGGNPDLKRAFIHNYDVRLEMFPAVGEVLAISWFRKSISNAIEEELIQTSTRSLTYFNSTHAENSGWELEVRKSLQFLGEYWGNILITANYTRIESRVEYQQTEGSSATGTVIVNATRPMQGQSPYMINLALLFTEPAWGTSISILYNKFGSRLATVGINGTPDTYEEPRDIVDLAIMQPIVAGLEGKFTIKNLNGKARTLTRAGRLYELTGTGTSYSVQLSLSL